jgi:ankyrin repeat protein
VIPGHCVLAFSGVHGVHCSILVLYPTPTRSLHVRAKDKYGNTALIAAACECAVVDMPETLPSMKLLLEKGADVNAKNRDGNTALTLALKNHQADVAALLKCAIASGWR